MKKISLFILTILIMMPLVVFAAENPKVLTLESNSEDNKISYNGTMEENSHAVMCKLLNSEGEEIDKLSVAVDNSEFSGAFTIANSGDYKVACANYEGGEIKEAVVSATAVIEDVATNPKTGDSIYIWCGLVVVSLLGLGIKAFASNRAKRNIGKID